MAENIHYVSYAVPHQISRNSRIHFPSLSPVVSPPVGVITVELLYPEQGAIDVPRDAVIHVRATSTVPLVGSILELVYGEDEDTGESDLVHNGSSFRGRYDTQDSVMTPGSGGGLYWRDYYIGRADAWPLIRTNFFVYVFDSSGQVG